VDTCRHDRFSGSIDEGLDAVVVVCVTRNQNLEIVRQADKAAIEHPVCSSEKRNAVRKNVRAARFP
jgi:hypothetical protein